MSTERLISTQGVRCKLTTSGLTVIDQKVGYTGEEAGYFGCYPGNTTDKKPNTILFKDILSCQHLDEEIHQISYITLRGKSIDLNTLIIKLEDANAVTNVKTPEDLTQYINNKAYENSQFSPSILVLINPNGGKGKAIEIYNRDIQPVLIAANVLVDVQYTKYSGHAKDIAKDLDISKYDIIVCCSGDGIPHEVMNGFYQRKDKGLEAFNKLAITQLPCGSGNALSLSTHGTNDAKLATYRMLKATRTKLDLMAVTQLNDENEEVTSLSFCSQCYGAVADADIGTDHLRWMGPIRFDLGVAHKVLTRARFPCDLYIKYLTTTKKELIEFFNENYESQKSKTINPITLEDLQPNGPSILSSPPSDWIELDAKISSNISIFYVGKVPMVSTDAQFFPAALPNDGSMDLIITDINSSLADSVKALLSVEKGGHIEFDGIAHHKILSYRLIPRIDDGSKHYISIDGEDFPFKTLQVEVLPGILTCLLDKGLFVDTSLTK